MDIVREQTPLTCRTVDESGPYPIIRGVRLCGLTSEHGYDYLPTAWAGNALKLYEGIDSYEGHKDGVRLPSEKVGVFRNITRRPDGTPQGDYLLEPDHPMTPRLIRAAKHNPTLYAMSHQAHVRWGTRDGRKVVEGLGRVHSVDVVSRGGTTGGIFEAAPAVVHGGSEKQDERDRSLLERIDEAVRLFLKGSRQPGAVKKLLADVGDAVEWWGQITFDPSAPPPDPNDDKPRPRPAGPDPLALMRECAAGGLAFPTPGQLLALRGIPDRPTRTAFIREQAALVSARSRESSIEEAAAVMRAMAAQVRGSVPDGALNRASVAVPR
jgi:hypothetical protein